MRTVLFLLGELDDDDIDWLIEAGDRQEVAAGTVLIHEGQTISTLFILLEGALSVTTAASNGQEIANVLSGDIVGEMSFVDTRPPSATVTAKQNSIVLSISKEQLTQKLELDGGFAARFYRALAISLSTRLRLTVSRLQNFALPSSPEYELSMNELTKDAKENVALAKTRLDWLLRRLQDEAG
ncbi:MAG: cyclic nucleotide-binding domain-containing protein [Oscillatoriales cyanobacterium C42_A2020_001]|nr:cyclic nucleotide-binding domain-containing protein [Leptolyngbyaceae cyanobacterium C42_A2020_001]